MKKFFLVCVILLTCSQVIKADTICYWRIYHNGELLKAFSETTVNPEVSILLDLEFPDTLTTRFYKDTPCHDCQCTLLILDDKHRFVEKIQNKGTASPLTVGLLELQEYNVRTENNYLHFYYFENDERLKILLFKLKIY